MPGVVDRALNSLIFAEIRATMALRVCFELLARINPGIAQLDAEVCEILGAALPPLRKILRNALLTNLYDFEFWPTDPLNEMQTGKERGSDVTHVITPYSRLCLKRRQIFGRAWGTKANVRED